MRIFFARPGEEPTYMDETATVGLVYRNHFVSKVGGLNQLYCVDLAVGVAGH